MSNDFKACESSDSEPSHHISANARSTSPESGHSAMNLSEELSLAADTVILAAGAWSPTLLSSLPITGTRAHSIVIRSSMQVDVIAPYVLFTSIALPAGGRNVTPEIYPRPDSTIYVCGPGDTREALPLTVDGVKTDPLACEEIWEWVAETGIIRSNVLGEIQKYQACYLPIVENEGGPIIGNVPNMKGLVVATGHTCWVCDRRPALCNGSDDVVSPSRESATHRVPRKQ